MRNWLLIFMLGMGVLSSCDDEERCYESTDTYMMTRFVESNGMSIDSLLIWGVDKDDLGWVRDTLVQFEKYYPLPLSLNHDTTAFVLFANGKADTLTLIHRMQMQLVSEECGFAPYYQLSDIEFTERIDSVGLSDAAVNPESIEKSEDDENITVYFNWSVD